MILCEWDVPEGHSGQCWVYSLPPPAVRTHRVYPFPPPAGWTHRVYPFLLPEVWTCRMYTFPPPAAVYSVDVQVYPFNHQQKDERAGCISFQYQWYGRAGVPLSTTSSVNVQGILFLLMTECRTVWLLISAVPEWTKILMSETVQYVTEIQDAGMPMPAASALMPMPSYDQGIDRKQ